jgi:double-stranded uracil-DNA glycosylase
MRPERHKSVIVLPAESVPTLPDLLATGLRVVFVGINPSLYSVERGHYFARGSNRFWPCISRSNLTLEIRKALGVEQLGPEHDRVLPRFGLGFTDLVKRPTARAGDLARAEFAAGSNILARKLERFKPQVACFHGVTGYDHVRRFLMDDGGNGREKTTLGLQRARIGATRIFVVPNPSGANAHYSRAQQTAWYDALAAYLTELRASSA